MDNPSDSTPPELSPEVSSKSAPASKLKKPRPPLPKWLWLVIGLLSLIIVILAGIVIENKLGDSKALAPTSSPTASVSPSAAATSPATTSPSPTATPQVNGALQVINRDLHLMPATTQTGEANQTTYYQAGTYTGGKYSGYERVVVLRQATDPGGVYTYVLATRDESTYILDADPAWVTAAAGNWQDPFAYLDRSKVTAVEEITSDLSTTISLNSKYLLFQEKLAVADDTSPATLLTDFSKYTALASPVSTLRLYAPKRVPETLDAEGTTQADRDREAAMQRYVSGDSQVIAVDGSGLAYQYVLTTAANYQIYQNGRTADLQGIGEQTKDPSKNYTPLTDPNLRLSKNQVASPVPTNLYNHYDVAFPHGCGLDINTPVLQNISDSDVTSLMTGPAGLTYYTLKDNNHALYEAAYNAKVGAYTQFFGEYNNSQTPPTYAQYLAKHPLLLAKDYWNRWYAIGEFDYNLPGGCGKPVVYLYPTKPTAVKVQLTAPTHFDVDLPTYHNGWQVLAQPNGQLTDLQPQWTDCAGIPQDKFGMEYAPAACASKTYPYLYWAGQSFAAPYPTVTQGWVVPQAQLSGFLQDKLSFMGLTAPESADMLSYWVPTLEAKAAPYYRIAFLQTAAMNRLAPMSIQPAPDSLLRVFLDWSPLVAQPGQLPEPQTLQPFDRQGFTVVEWGGLKR